MESTTEMVTGLRSLDMDFGPEWRRAMVSALKADPRFQALRKGEQEVCVSRAWYSDAAGVCVLSMAETGKHAGYGKSSSRRARGGRSAAEEARRRTARRNLAKPVEEGLFRLEQHHRADGMNSTATTALDPAVVMVARGLLSRQFSPVETTTAWGHFEPSEERMSPPENGNVPTRQLLVSKRQSYSTQNYRSSLDGKPKKKERKEEEVFTSSQNPTSEPALNALEVKTLEVAAAAPEVEVPSSAELVRKFDELVRSKSYRLPDEEEEPPPYSFED